MPTLRNSILLRAVLKALYSVAGRRTSERFADETIGSTIKTLESKYDFLKYVLCVIILTSDKSTHSTK